MGRAASDEGRTPPPEPPHGRRGTAQLAANALRHAGVPQASTDRQKRPTAAGTGSPINGEESRPWEDASPQGAGARGGLMQAATTDGAWPRCPRLSEVIGGYRTLTKRFTLPLQRESIHKIIIFKN